MLLKECMFIVCMFNNFGKILLFFTKVGGVGFNLVGVNRLVLVDLLWNFVYDL